MPKVRLYTARQQGLSFQNLFGQLGPEHFVSGHHTAGPVDHSLAEAMRLCRQYHAQHKAQGWGGIGYHVCIPRHQGPKGELRILLLRPLVLKGAHVGGHNTSNVGIMFHGTLGNHPSIHQMRALQWYLNNAHTRRIPPAHRSDRNLRGATRKGHKDWSGHQSNACPGGFHTLILSGGKRR
jgi:hypothetical protein